MEITDIVVGIVKDYLVEQIKHEAQVLSELEGKVELTQKGLERLNAFLKDSEGKRDNEKVKVIIKQIREAAYKIEDVIDNYIVNVITQKNRDLNGEETHLIDHSGTLNSVNDDIDQINKNIEEIYKDIDQFGIKQTDIDESAAAASAQIAELVLRRRTNVEEDEVVGFDDYSKEVVKLLVEGNSSRDVVSIVGMAGLGKTTLARKVYRDLQISSKKHFDHCAWQVVGEYDVKEILLGIWRSLESVKQNKRNISESGSNKKISEALDIAMVKKELREYLKDTCYLIVLDDVWSKNIWDEIKDAFPDDGLGSRILITSRQEKEASAIGNNVSNTSPCYQLQRLSDHHSWELFSKKVFWEEDSRPTLKTLGEKIVKDCKGLPLSIVVIAGILLNKERSERVWEQVAEHVNWYINSEDIVVREIVRLSYDDLPPYLKPCFLYLAIYPEDFEIPVRQLIQLWIAEGFIKETGLRTPEDVAEHYLDELIRRSLIQVERRRTDGGVKTCRIHDLLRDICVTECKENQILEVRKDVSNEGQPRRLSLHCSAPYYMSGSSCDHSITRSLFCLNMEAYKTSPKDVEMICNNFKLLRVLDVGQIEDSVSSFLRRLHDISHLRYFRAIRKGWNYTENSIHKLLYLQTLDMRNTTIKKLPKELWKLKQLRHLYIDGINSSLPDIPGKKSLPNLQTLSKVLLDEQTVKQLKKTPNLRKLGVSCSFSKSSNPLELLARLQHLSHLTTLKVFFPIFHLPSVNGFPPNITKITLVGFVDAWSGIIKPLGSLLKLQYLKLSGFNPEMLDNVQLECDDAGCFPQLLVLKMKGLKCESWKMAQGSMPQLQSLVINRCEFPTDLPDAQFFTALQELQVLWSSKEVVDKFQNLGLKDSCKITVFPAIGEED